jgi:acyl carrier protein
MEHADILKNVNLVFIDILDNQEIVLKDTTTAADIPEWDSLTHIQLVVGIEKHFKTRFTSAEIREWKDVGQMCACIQKRLGI